MRNTSETDYVIKCNHVSADGHFDSFVTLVFCPGQTTWSAYLRKKMYGSFVLHLYSAVCDYPVVLNIDRSKHTVGQES